MSKETIDVSEEVAEFIEALTEFFEPQFLGEYTPQYATSDTMAGLKFEESSPIVNFDVKCGFTLEGKEISAFIIDLEQNEKEIMTVLNKLLPNLKGLKELVIKLDFIPENFDLTNLIQLEYLQIHNKTEEPLIIPSSLSHLDNLIVLKTRGPVNDFPTDLHKLSKLQRLVMKNVLSPKFPNLIGLDKLVWLEIGSQFSKIPKSIAELSSLVILEIDANNLTSLPDNFGDLSDLRHLSIESQSLSSLPVSFGKLFLTDLYLWSLNFKELPEVICQIVTLSHFWYKDNARMVGTLESIPPCLGNLTELVDLQLNGHQITQIPAEFASLHKLEILNLGINELSSLPDGIFSIKSLKRLELYYNKFTKFPDLLRGLPNLEYLDLSDNQLSTLPDSIGGLPLLDELDLMGNPIESFPDGFLKLHPFQFSTFMVTLKTPPDQLAQDIQDWLEKMVKYSERNPEKMILEISLFDDENQPETDDSE